MDSVEYQQRQSSGSSPRHNGHTDDRQNDSLFGPAAPATTTHTTATATSRRSLPHPASIRSSPAFKYESPRPRQLTNLTSLGGISSAIRSAPHTPHTPTNTAAAAAAAAAAYASAVNPDGSLSVIRNDEDANNSGLLDLSPALVKRNWIKSTLLPPINGTPSSSSRLRPRSSLSKSTNRGTTNNGRSENLADLGEEELEGEKSLLSGSRTKQRASTRKKVAETVPSSQPADDFALQATTTGNGLAAFSEEEEEEEEEDVLMHANGTLDGDRPNALTGDDMEDDEEDETDSATPTTLLARLRRWRHDAMHHHLYETAIFWGTKVLSLESTAVAYNDAFHLAQCFFYTHQYARAEHLLTTPLRTGASRSGSSTVSLFGAHATARSEPPNKTGAEAFLVSENAQDDNDDALLDVLTSTRANSILPPSLMARSTTKDSVYSTTSSTTGKRKLREFNVSATGTGSSDTDSGDGDDNSISDTGLNGAPDQMEDGSLSGAAQETNGSIIDRKKGKRQKDSGRNPRHRKHGHSHRGSHIKDDAKLLLHDLAEVRDKEVPPPDGPVLVDHSSACRYLAAQCQVRLGKYHEALDLLGQEEQWATSPMNKKPAMDGAIKLGSSMSYLRGQIHLRLEDLPRARESFMAALACDVKNYEAFSALIEGDMLGIEEQWNFVQGLEYVAQAGEDQRCAEDHEFVRLVYTTRLSKQGKDYAINTASARRRLASEFGLSNDPDVLLGLAEELFARLRYVDAFVVTSRILELSADHPSTLPIHIACTYHLKTLRPALFMLAHRLTELQPESAVSWYAVGVWYATTRRWAEARRYFSKASLLDPRFAPSWIAFGHTFALEGESDQAIIAYSTAARLFPQSHLPKLFVGMEHLHQDNLSLARLSLEASASIWPDDPLTANERGIVAFQTGDLESAATFFRSAIHLASETQHPASSWKACYLNLGLSLLRLGLEEDASTAFAKVTDLDPHNYQAWLALGMIAHRQDQLDDAIQYYHEALAINPRDPHATDLLDFALEEKVHYGVVQFVKYDPQGRFSTKNGHRKNAHTIDVKGKGKGRADDTDASKVSFDLDQSQPLAPPKTHHYRQQDPNNTSLSMIQEDSADNQLGANARDIASQSHSLPHSARRGEHSAAPAASSPYRTQDQSAAEMSLDDSSSMHIHNQSTSVTMDESNS